MNIIYSTKSKTALFWWIVADIPNTTVPPLIPGTNQKALVESFKSFGIEQRRLGIPKGGSNSMQTRTHNYMSERWQEECEVWKCEESSLRNRDGVTFVAGRLGKKEERKKFIPLGSGAAP